MHLITELLVEQIKKKNCVGKMSVQSNNQKSENGKGVERREVWDLCYLYAMLQFYRLLIHESRSKFLQRTYDICTH